MRTLCVVTATGLLSLAALGTALVRAEAPTTAPSTQPTDSASVKSDHVTIKPYSGLTDLTAEQVEKMNQIHKQYLDDRREMDRKHDADLMAVLTDAQKGELKSLHEKELADAKAKRADMRQKSKEQAPAEKK